MKRPWMELALQSLVFLFFTVLSVPNLSSAGQYGPGPLDGKNTAGVSGAFLLDTDTTGGPFYETSQGSILNRRTFGQTVSAYPYSPSILQNKYKLESYRSGAFDFEFSSVLKGAMKGHIIDIGTAFATNVIIHELGHDIMADHVGAEGSSLSFLQSKNGQFFFASSTVQSIDASARLPYSMGGEFAADFTFEYALSSYRTDPTLYNKSLMFFSGTEMLWYSIYAFYLSEGNDNLDPIAITRYSGISKEAVLSVALAKTIMNAYRIYSGKDTVIPHFMVTDDSVTLNLTVAF
ncbi:MAG: hypothetical protein Q7T18_06770 [Sedimentisphaerales bacterium]|nr:hypothetical protein [Sedimentisphaerales bacterium]